MTTTARRVRMYSLYERIWHWTQAACVALLLLTGLEVRGAIRLLGFERAAGLHDAVGFLLLGNAALGLFHFATTGAIRQYVQTGRGVATLAARQVRYYLRGIFRGEPHPVERTVRARLNPIQKVVYTGILNVLLPWQILTGLLAWGIARWPWVEGWTGGLDVLLPLHALGAWLFAAFLVAHVYLTTTSGRRPLSGIASMVTGWEEAPGAADPPTTETCSCDTTDVPPTGTPTSAARFSAPSSSCRSS